MIDKTVLIKCLAVVNTTLVIIFIASNMICLMIPRDNTNTFIAETAIACVGNIGILWFLIIADDNDLRKKEVNDSKRIN